MNCFYHPDKPAVGSCKYCHRGLCIECAAIIDDVLACQHRHEDEVHKLEQLAARNLFQSRRVSSSYTRNAVFYGLVGTLFVWFGYAQYRFIGMQAVFFMLIGLFLFYAAAANYFESRKHQ
jgi:hypothetical protein